MIVCARCKGRGKLSTVYSEVMEAEGLFYDRNVIREVRTITMKCRNCNGTGMVEEKTDGNA